MTTQQQVSWNVTAEFPGIAEPSRICDGAEDFRAALEATDAAFLDPQTAGYTGGERFACFRPDDRSGAWAELSLTPKDVQIGRGFSWREFSGERDARGFATPVGEEKRVDAACSALTRRAPENVIVRVGTPGSVDTQASGFHDYDLWYPLCAVTLGGSFSSRRAALIGHVPVHVTNTGAVEWAAFYPERVSSQMLSPRLIAVGNDGEVWHYRGSKVVDTAYELVRAEMQQRGMFDVYDSVERADAAFSGTELDFGSGIQSKLTHQLDDVLFNGDSEKLRWLLHAE